jgi:hypothetical protein
MFKNFLTITHSKLKKYFHYKNIFSDLYGDENKEPETELDYNINISRFDKIKKLKSQIFFWRMKHNK